MGSVLAAEKSENDEWGAFGVRSAPPTASTLLFGKNMSFFCYILECADGTYYTGWSTDPNRRLKQHNAGRGAKYTRTRRPVSLLYTEEQPDRSTAMKREIAIKRFSRAQKQALIKKYPKSMVEN